MLQHLELVLDERERVGFRTWVERLKDIEGPRAAERQVVIDSAFFEPPEFRAFVESARALMVRDRTRDKHVSTLLIARVLRAAGRAYQLQGN